MSPSLLLFWLRRPVLASAVAFLLLLSTVRILLLVGEDVRDRGWATALLLAAVVVSGGLTAWVALRKVNRLHPLQVVAQLFSFGTFPYPVGAVLLFLGAEAWSLWVAVLAVGIQLAWMAWLLRDIDTTQVQHDPPA